ncbi:hypothetical protein Tco_0995981 [Tanacetum coccineum]
MLCKLSKKVRKPTEDSQALEAQVKELVGYEGFPMSPQSYLLLPVKELMMRRQMIRDTQDTDDEDAKTESDEDEIYKNNIHVRKDEDVEMTNVEVEDSEKGNTEISDVAQADVEKTEEIKDAAKKTKLPPTSSSLSVSSGFGDQFLKLSYDNSLVSIVKDNTDAEINLLLEVKIQSEVPHIESPSVLRVLVPLRGAKLENDVSALKNIDHSAKTIDTLKSQVPTKHSEDLIKKHYVKPAPGSSKIQSPTVNLKQGSEKSPSKILKTRIRRQRGEEPRSQSLQRNHPSPKKPLKVKLHLKALNLEKMWFVMMINHKMLLSQRQPRLRTPTPDPEWNKHQVVLGHPGHPIVAANYFFNNNLEYLKSSDLEKTYTTSITKTKAARYEIVGIEDMVPTLWSPTKVGYDKDALKGHAASCCLTHAIHLNDSDIVDFIVALRMFTRSLIIKKRVEDLELGVESYQKKLNITPPQQTFLEIELKEL